MPNFRVFKKSSIPITDKPQVTIQKGGRAIAINGPSYDALGKPAAVELLYDPDENFIGFRPAEPDMPHAVPLRQQQRSQNHTVAGTAFTKYVGVDTSIARRYSAEMMGDTLAVDLKQEAADATGPRATNRARAYERRPKGE